MRYIMAILVTLLATSAPAASTSEVYANSKASVVLIMSYDNGGIPLAIGSGFFVEPRKLVTNYHVVEGSSRLVYKLIGENITRDVRAISRFSVALDIAILETAEDNIPLTVGSAKDIAIGDKVVAIGNPKGLEGSVSEGIVSAKRETGKDIFFLQITAPISPGSSGGPLFDSSGRVIAITTATIESGQNLNFAIPVDYIGRVAASAKTYEPTVNKSLSTPRTNTAGLELIEPEMNDISGNVKYSVKNTTKNTISNPLYMLIFRNKNTREIIHFVLRSGQDVIPAGLAKRYAFQDQSLNGYMTFRRNTFPYFVGDGDLSGFLEIELRTLTYEITDRGVGTDILDALSK